MNASSDHDADASIDRLFESHAATALRLRQSTVAERRSKLTKLLGAILERKEAILDAAHRDLGKHPTETNLTEVLPLVGEAKHAIAKLKRWMKPERIGPTAATLGTHSRVVYQPKGRCLIISPWNYPLSLTLGPLVSAVAAGNTVILKPSEFTSHTNRVVRDIIGAVFSPDEVAVVEGAAQTATELLSLPFDHIFFTGSPAVGKKVMAAAALQPRLGDARAGRQVARRRGRQRGSSQRCGTHHLGKDDKRGPDLYRAGPCVRASRRRGQVRGVVSQHDRRAIWRERRSHQEQPRLSAHDSPSAHRARRPPHRRGGAVRQSDRVRRRNRCRCALCRTDAAARGACECANSQRRDLWPGTADPDFRFSGRGHRGDQCRAEALGHLRVDPE